ncbi:hypothetical protein EUTSA_v10028089mg [Eutrema salsugineum]|uniref:GBF-interacting protein 1 N-terminal domain-containing protein n=1 Tax=Eutrema salsugineum TaxID=72664 RepID=V4NLQ1_EUTSA|nr:hypothetical protein EUTSA_v10028089mg [Eutrema salsugineum]
MGGLGSGGDSGVSNVNTGVSASSRKVVQSLKEIVNCSDLEIYAMLVECDMDPDETVNRLLSQDTFHKVKSKRDKKKKTKNPAESWTRSTPNRRARSSGNDSYNTARGGGNRYNSNESGSVQGVPANRRENRTHNHWAVSSSSSSGVLGRQPLSNSDPTNVEVKKAPTGLSDEITSSSLPSPAYQSAWANANLGQRTMADIVKMGRPLYQKNVTASRSLETQESGSKAPLKDEWPSIEKQDPLSSLVKPSAESSLSTNQFSESQHLNKTHLDDENPIAYPPNGEQVLPPASVSSRNLVDGDSRESSVYDDESNNAERHAFEENGAENVSASVATGFQQLTIDNDEEHETLPKDDKPAVIIPNHLQVNTSECSHLMFGSFSSRIGSGQASGLNETLEETQDESSFRHPDTDYYGEEEGQQLRNFSSPADYGFENRQQLNPPSETNPQMQNLDAFPNVMQQGYTSSLPNNLLPSGIQDTREPDIHYSPFQTKYNTATLSSPSGPAISMAEAIRAASMSSQNAMPGAGQQAAALAQHLALNTYVHQPGMPVGHYGNLISYPFMPQSYNPYMPLAFQQAFPTSNHQTLAAMHLQYKNQETAPPVLPPSAYGFGSGAPSSNNFPLAPTTSANSYEDVLSLYFMDRNHLALSLQQQVKQ